MGQAVIDARKFRQVLGCYPTGVCVVTGMGMSGTPAGLAVGSFTSVSLAPPLVAFCPDKASTSWPQIAPTGRFCVNVLAEDQHTVCATFASKGADKFQDLAYTLSPSGAPVLTGALAWIDCALHAAHDAGDHLIVLGEVLDMAAMRNCGPLLFFRGGYGGFAGRGAGDQA